MYRLIYFVNICCVIGLLLGYLSPYINPEISESMTIFGLLFPLLVIANILFVLFWIFNQPKFCILSLVTLISGYNSIGGLVQLGKVESDVEANLNIMSYNVRGLHLSPNDQRKLEAMENYFKIDNNIDVFCIQEKRAAGKSLISKVLKDFDSIESEFYMAIFSKLPIIDKGTVSVGGNTMEAVWADIKHTNGKIFRIYSYHLSSNLISKTTDDLIEEGSFSERTFTGLKSIIGSYTGQTTKRKKQLDILLHHVRNSPHPVVMAGDMNDIPQSYIYRQFRKLFSDTFRDKGKGFGTSYGENYPLLRIDYIFPDNHFTTASHTVDKVRFSDHYPVKASLKF